MTNKQSSTKVLITDLLNVRMEIDPNPKFMEEITPYIKVETSCSLRKHGIIFLSKRLNN